LKEVIQPPTAPKPPPKKRAKTLKPKLQRSSVKDPEPGAPAKQEQEGETVLVPGSKEWRAEIEAWKENIDKGLQEYEADQRREMRQE
jgi:hypothetical protein